jgi:signal peptidase I
MINYSNEQGSFTYKPWSKLKDGDLVYIDGLNNKKRRFYGPHTVVSGKQRALLSSSNGKEFSFPQDALWTTKSLDESPLTDIRDVHKLNWDLIKRFKLRKGYVLDFPDGTQEVISSIHPAYGWVLTSNPNRSQSVNDIYFSKNGVFTIKS